VILYEQLVIQLDESNYNLVSLSKNLGFLAYLYYQEENYTKALSINNKQGKIACQIGILEYH